MIRPIKFWDCNEKASFPVQGLWDSELIQQNICSGVKDWIGDKIESSCLIRSVHYLLFSVVFIGLLIFSGCLSAENLRMATTTSTENSGLLKELNPLFEKRYGVKVHVIAVGTGKALRIAADGDVDLVFVHAPEAELEFVEQGHGIERQAVMHNDFLIVGPPGDPARLRSAKTVAEAFQFIAKQQSPFVSRGDDSGTHKKEQVLWRAAEVKPQGRWYISAGQGMGAVLTMADETGAYGLSDRGTYLAFMDRVGIEPVFECDPELFNPYHIIAVNPKKHTGVKYSLARRYISYVTGEEGQRAIAAFKQAGRQVFYPDVLPHLANER